jgi:tRNA A-37 threonylcarbamoyl transferase component Bud32
VSSIDPLEQAIGDWLLAKEAERSLLPGAFAQRLAEPLRSQFLRELEQLAEIDGLATAAPPRDLPRRFGDFRVLGELGRGAMGAVYDAEQVSTGRRVALKVLHAHVARDLQSASRFRREARTAAALRHPGIVPVLAFGETDGASWLAMERVDGRSLQRLLAASAEPRDVDHRRAGEVLASPQRIAALLADAADALEFAHRENVVHRDIKPANLMVREDGRIAVLDFGLATAREADAATLTRTGDFLGTPLYMAPEQARGAENGDPRSDVWSLGAVLYECLGGEPPFRPGPLATVLDSILNRDPVSLRKLAPSVPEDLARIVMQCLEKEPARRYPTAAALADDLRRFVDGNVVQARASGGLQRSLRRLRARPAIAVLGGLLLVAVPLATWAWLRGDREADRAVTLQQQVDLQAAHELLNGAPERLTMFGGASLRFYRRLGLGDASPAGSSRSPAAAKAIQLAEQAVAVKPTDVAALRALATVLLDVGDDAARTGSVLEQLLAQPAHRPADRAMAAVWQRQQGREAEAQRLRAALPPADVDVQFWLGFFHQDEQDHAAAITAFSKALDGDGLGSDRRYWALLHRGWCRTCPDIADIGAAKTDLLQAAALRPKHGTARLLWAALCCLEATKEADLKEPVEAVQAVLKVAEPWVHVLTARVLLALAEGGTALDGPVHFGSEFSPIAVLPVIPGFAQAFAGLGMQILDGVLASTPAAFEAGLHRSTALALLGRSAEALVAVDRLQPGAAAAQQALLDLQRARIQLAAGRAPLARQSIDRALGRDARSVGAWRFAADLALHVGDARRELQAVEQAVRHLAEQARDSSVFPDAAAMLPELQLRRVRLMAALGQRGEAVTLLQNDDFGGLLAGANAPRIRVQRALLARELAAPGGLAAVELPAGSPLRWLLEGGEPAAIDAAAKVAIARGWLPATGIRRFATDAAIAPVLQRQGILVPEDVAKTPLSMLLPNVPTLLRSPGADARLLALADARLHNEPGDGEARLLRALVLHLTQRSGEAAEFLAKALAEHGDDLRGRYLLAVAASAAGAPELLRSALRVGRSSLSAAELDAAKLRLPAIGGITGESLLQQAR